MIDLLTVKENTSGCFWATFSIASMNVPQMVTACGSNTSQEFVQQQWFGYQI